jgi:hypothetical protein
MSEIEKMYENAGIEPTHYDACALEDKYWNNEELANQYGTFDSYLSFECPHYGEGCYSTCEYAYDKDKYPPFTAEKQLEIVKQILFSTWWLNLKRLQFSEKFDEGLAQMINELWQDLTPKEKQQAKGILE